jgi:hypothetical protein
MALFVLFLSSSFAGMGQTMPKVHLLRGKMTCGAIFDSITRQLQIGVERSHVRLDTGRYVNIPNTSMQLDTLLKLCLEPMGMTYLFMEETILIIMKPTEPGGPMLFITVIVTGFQGERLSGALIHLSNSPDVYMTGSDGSVTFSSKRKAELLLISHPGYKKEHRLVSGSGLVEIRMDLVDELEVAGIIP